MRVMQIPFKENLQFFYENHAIVMQFSYLLKPNIHFMQLSCDYHAIIVRILKNVEKSVLVVHKNKKTIFLGVFLHIRIHSRVSLNQYFTCFSFSCLLYQTSNTICLWLYSDSFLEFPKGQACHGTAAGPHIAIVLRGSFPLPLLISNCSMMGLLICKYKPF